MKFCYKFSIITPTIIHFLLRDFLFINSIEKGNKSFCVVCSYGFSWSVFPQDYCSRNGADKRYNNYAVLSIITFYGFLGNIFWIFCTRIGAK